MNNVFKVIYDKSSGKYVVASELAKSGKKAKNIMATATVATVSAFLLQGNALADATPP